MKKILLLATGSFILCLALVISKPETVKAQDVSVSFQSFYDNLAPYGQWIYDPHYGNVFVPYEDAGFRPYTRGYWAMTDYGNTWVSNDPWAWACYHYGRWTYNGYYGWVWIPGYEWAPAWVSWRWGHGYCGWAPLGPDYALGGEYYCPETWWVFVEPRYIYEPRWHDYYGGWDRNRYYLRHTEYMDNYDASGRYGHYNYGPRVEVIERETHHPVTVYRTTEVRESGAVRAEGNTISVYRPMVDRNTMNTARPATVIQAPRPINSRGEDHPRRTETNAVPAFHQEHPMPAAHTPEPVRTNPQPTQHMPGTMQQQNHQPEPPVRQPAPQNHYDNNPAPQMHQPEPPVRQPAPQQQYNNNPGQQMHQPEPPARQPEPQQMRQPERQPESGQQQHNYQQQTQPQMHQPQGMPQQQHGNNPGNQPHPQPNRGGGQHKEEKKK